MRTSILGRPRPQALACTVFLPFAQHDVKRMLQVSRTTHAVTRVMSFVSKHTGTDSSLASFQNIKQTKGRLMFLEKARSYEHALHA